METVEVEVVVEEEEEVVEFLLLEMSNYDTLHISIS
jgi:hypothetical protein